MGEWLQSLGAFFWAAWVYWLAFAIAFLVDALDLWDRYGKRVLRRIVPTRYHSSGFRRMVNRSRKSRWSPITLRALMVAAVFLGATTAFHNLRLENTNLHAIADSNRPEISLSISHVDLRREMVVLKAYNSGDRMAEEIRAFFHPTDTLYDGVKSAPIYDLGPQSSGEVQFQLKVFGADGPAVGLNEWADETDAVRFLLYACHSFAGKDYFTATWSVTCYLTTPPGCFVSQHRKTGREVGGCLNNNSVPVITVQDLE